MENEINNSIENIGITLAEMEKGAEQEAKAVTDLDATLAELKKNCEELDATLKELRAYIFS